MESPMPWRWLLPILINLYRDLQRIAQELVRKTAGTQLGEGGGASVLTRRYSVPCRGLSEGVGRRTYETDGANERIIADLVNGFEHHVKGTFDSPIIVLL